MMKSDGKGPTVTIIQVGSYIFGGYTEVSWSRPSPSKYVFISRAGFFQFVSLLDGKHLFFYCHLLRLNFLVSQFSSLEAFAFTH